MKRRGFPFKLISLISLFFLFSSVVLFAQGATSQSNLDAPIQVVDSRNRTITLSEPPDRIVSLSPNITEILFALDLGDSIVGRTDYCDYPAEAASIVSMGDLFSPSIEMIVASNPDIVLISTLGQSQTVDAIEQANIPVAYFNQSETLEGTYNLIKLIGDITGTTDKAVSITDSMRSLIEKVKNNIKDVERPSVYYVAGFGEWGDFTATGDTFIHDLITIAGADNIASDASNWLFQAELIINRDPDIVILPPSWGSTFEDTKAQFIHMEPYRNLRAVQNDAIYPFDNGMIERQGPRSALAVLRLAKLFHPSILWEHVE